MEDQKNTGKFHQYSVSISTHLHNKLEKHVFLMKKLVRSGHTKQRWLNEAIEEKLRADCPSKELDNEKRISFRIDDATKNCLEEHVELIRSFRHSYSKRKWILDAIQEKLDQEEDGVKKRLLKESKDHLETNMNV